MFLGWRNSCGVFLKKKLRTIPARTLLCEHAEAHQARWLVYPPPACASTPLVTSDDPKHLLRCLGSLEKRKGNEQNVACDSRRRPSRCLRAGVLEQQGGRGQEEGGRGRKKYCCALPGGELTIPKVDPNCIRKGGKRERAPTLHAGPARGSACGEGKHWGYVERDHSGRRGGRGVRGPRGPCVASSSMRRAQWRMASTA